MAMVMIMTVRSSCRRWYNSHPFPIITLDPTLFYFFILPLSVIYRSLFLCIYVFFYPLLFFFFFFFWLVVVVVVV